MNEISIFLLLIIHCSSESQTVQKLQNYAPAFEYVINVSNSSIQSNNAADTNSTTFYELKVENISDIYVQGNDALVPRSEAAIFINISKDANEMITLNNNQNISDTFNNSQILQSKSLEPHNYTFTPLETSTIQINSLSINIQNSLLESNLIESNRNDRGNSTNVIPKNIIDNYAENRITEGRNVSITRCENLEVPKELKKADEASPRSYKVDKDTKRGVKPVTESTREEHSTNQQNIDNTTKQDFLNTSTRVTSNHITEMPASSIPVSTKEHNLQMDNNVTLLNTHAIYVTPTPSTNLTLRHTNKMPTSLVTTSTKQLVDNVALADEHVEYITPTLASFKAHYFAPLNASENTNRTSISKNDPCPCLCKLCKTNKTENLEHSSTVQFHTTKPPKPKLKPSIMMYTQPKLEIGFQPMVGAAQAAKQSQKKVKTTPGLMHYSTQTNKNVKPLKPNKPLNRQKFNFEVLPQFSTSKAFLYPHEESYEQIEVTRIHKAKSNELMNYAKYITFLDDRK